VYEFTYLVQFKEGIPSPLTYDSCILFLVGVYMNVAPAASLCLTFRLSKLSLFTAKGSSADCLRKIEGIRNRIFTTPALRSFMISRAVSNIHKIKQKPRKRTNERTNKSINQSINQSILSTLSTLSIVSTAGNLFLLSSPNTWKQSDNEIRFRLVLVGIVNSGLIDTSSRSLQCLHDSVSNGRYVL
jgi:hypothetical protein